MADGVKSRKRQRKVDRWKRNMKKHKVNHGKPYVNASGRKISARKLKSPCDDTCRLKCKQKLNEEERQSLLEKFWEIGNINRQREYLGRHMNKIVPKYRYASTDRTHNYEYYFQVNYKDIKVCKKMFHNTLCISYMMTRTVRSKLDNCGQLKLERRGKHPKYKISEELKNNVRKHIESIPTIESHYLRAQTERKFFDGSLNLATLYRLYVEKCKNEGKQFLKYFQYAKIFNYEYNIGFFTPKKDQCSFCTSYLNAPSDEKDKIQSDYDQHCRNKNLVREQKKKDVEDSLQNKTSLVAVYDMQAVLPVPCAQASEFYYVSKLATMNFTIYNISNKTGTCYVWNETVGKRGSNEIGSFVYSYLKDLTKSTDDKNDVIFYTDNCYGQNKNRYIASMYLYCVNTLNNVQSITHKFLVTGHTQNEGDSMHSVIEKEKKRVLKGTNIYVPSQWIPVIALAKKTGKSYSVHEVEQSDIFDLKALTSKIGNNFTINSEGGKVNWTQIKILRFEKEHPKTIFYKTNYEEENFQKIPVSRSKRKPCDKNNLISLEPAYNGKLGIPKKKYDGLMQLCKKKLIKPEYHEFYENLLISDLSVDD